MPIKFSGGVLCPAQLVDVRLISYSVLCCKVTFQGGERTWITVGRFGDEGMMVIV